MKSSTRSALLAMTTVFLWSSAFPITKIAAQAFTPNALGLFRCTLAASILLGIGWKNHLQKPKSPPTFCCFFCRAVLDLRCICCFSTQAC